MDLIKFLELLDHYPGWLKATVVFWIVFSALIICGLVIFRSPANNYPQSNIAPVSVSSAKPSEPIISVTNISVEEIVDAVRAVPILQRENTATNFVDLEVEWIGYLKSTALDYRDKNKVRINLHVNKHKIVDYSIWFSVDLDNFPEFKLLHEHSKIRVRGRIISVSVQGLNVTLDPKEINILERATN